MLEGGCYTARHYKVCDTPPKCRRDYHHLYDSRRKVGKISRRDASVAHLPPLPVLCRKVASFGCHCSLLTSSTEHQMQLRRQHSSYVQESPLRDSGNQLLASCVTPCDQNPLGDGLTTRSGMNLSILNCNCTIPGSRHDGQSRSSKVHVCSPVFKKLHNLGKPRFKKLQHVTQTNHPVVDESVLSTNVSAGELPLDEGAPFCNDEQLGSDPSFPPIKCVIHKVADDDDPFLLVPSDEGAPTASDQHDYVLRPTST